MDTQVGMTNRYGGVVEEAEELACMSAEDGVLNWNLEVVMSALPFLTGGCLGRNHVFQC